MTTPTTTGFEYLCHTTSGEIWAVHRDTRQRVLEAVGPLSYHELTPTPEDFYPAMTDEDAEWFAVCDDQFRLLDGAELLQLIAVATERATTKGA